MIALHVPRDKRLLRNCCGTISKHERILWSGFERDSSVLNSTSKIWREPRSSTSKRWVLKFPMSRSGTMLSSELLTWYIGKLSAFCLQGEVAPEQYIRSEVPGNGVLAS